MTSLTGEFPDPLSKGMPLVRIRLIPIWVMSLVLIHGLVACPTSIWAQGKGIENFSKLSATNDWPWWRGPHRNGISDSAPVPIKFGDTENLVWKVEVPGRGHSSPTVVGDRIFLTTADTQRQIHYLLILDRTDGKLLKQVEINQGGFPAKNHAKNTEATPSVACDGERIFICFYHHDQVGLVALDLDGEIVWKKSAGPFDPQVYQYGYAPSPVLYQDLVIVVGEYQGDSFLTAFTRDKGDRKWKTPRPKTISFSSPVVGKIGGKDQLLISGAERVYSYDPQTGKQRWFSSGSALATCGTLVWDGDTVFASGGYPKAETVAVKADGSKKVLWKNNVKCYEQSLLATGGYVYAFDENGIMQCWRGSDGKEMWKQRLRGPESASPVLAGGHIYWANEIGTLYVFKPNPAKFDLVAENHIGTDSFASPAICGGQIFLRVGVEQDNRRQEYLYCFANSK